VESAISRQWYQLYENNPKIQAFAIIKGNEIVWQTNNWSLLEDITQIVNAQNEAPAKISVGGVSYKRVVSGQDSFIGSAGAKGHLLMVRINDKGWAVAWAESTSVPELALIDLIKATIHLSRDIL
jgi:hypothetical protein